MNEIQWTQKIDFGIIVHFHCCFACKIYSTSEMFVYLYSIFRYITPSALIIRWIQCNTGHTTNEIKRNIYLFIFPVFSCLSFATTNILLSFGVNRGFFLYELNLTPNKQIFLQSVHVDYFHFNGIFYSAIAQFYFDREKIRFVDDVLHIRNCVKQKWWWIRGIWKSLALCFFLFDSNEC